MSKINRYEYEGKVIEIPLRWDEHSKKEIEDYSLFIEQSPIYTPEPAAPAGAWYQAPVLWILAAAAAVVLAAVLIARARKKK